MFNLSHRKKWPLSLLSLIVFLFLLTATAAAGNPENEGQSMPALFFQSEAGELKAWLMEEETRAHSLIFDSVDPGWQAKALADMDGDGHPDIYFLHDDGRLKVWLMEGLEYVETVYPRNPATGEPQISPVWDVMAVADLSGSGNPDIIWQALEGPREGDLAIWLMDGLNADRFGRLYNHPGVSSVSPLWEIGAVFDLLGDSQPEVIWQSVTGEAFDQLAYWQLDVEGDEFTRSASARLVHEGGRAAIRSQWRMKAAVDLMGDGQHEIIFQGIAGNMKNRVSYWVMEGPARIGGGRLDPDAVSPGWSLFGAEMCQVVPIELVIREVILAESRFHQPGVSYNAASGLTYDGILIDPKTGQLMGLPRAWSAASKEALQVQMLSMAIAGNENARLFLAPENPEAAEQLALDILTKKITAYERFNDQYPGFGGFLPWFIVSDEGLEAAHDWKNRVPGLDNGQLAWALFQADHILRKAGHNALAQRYHSYWNMMAENAVAVFHDPGADKIRAEAAIADTSLPPHPANYSNYLEGYFLDDPFEGELLVLFLALLGSWEDQSALQRVWDNKTMAAVTYTTAAEESITVRQGHWYSSHEMWNFLVLPYNDIPLVHALFMNGEKARTLYSAENMGPCARIVAAAESTSAPACRMTLSALASSIGLPPPAA